MRAYRLWQGLALVALAGLFATPAVAQMPSYPPPGPPPGPDFACLCLKQSVDDLHADLAAKQNALGASQSRLNELDGQLAAARAQVNVNDAQSVAQFRQLLAERDGVFKQSNGGLIAATQTATAAYNQAVASYNGQCAGRPLPPPPPGPLVCR